MQCVEEKYDTKSESFVKEKRTDYEYGEGELKNVCVNIVEMDYFEPSSFWIRRSQTLVRKENGALVEEQYQNIGDNWGLYSQSRTFEDPAAGTKTVYNSVYDWDRGALVNYSLMETTYYPDGRIGLVQNYWDSNAVDWLPQTWQITKDCRFGNEYTEIYRWDRSEGAWYGVEKYERGYGADGAVIMNAEYSWNSSDRIWEGVGKTVEVKDRNGNQILYEYYSGIIDGVWQGITKSEAEYDDDGNRILNAFYDWNSKTGLWVGSYKHGSAHTAGYDMDAQYYWEYETGCWRGYSKTVDMVSADGTNTSESYVWNFDANDWAGISKNSTLKYEDELVRGSVYTTYVWDDASAAWFGDTRSTEESRWKSSRNIETEIKQVEKYDMAAGRWTSSSYQETVYCYDAATRVAGTVAAAQVLVRDGVISVSAAPGETVRVMTAAGVTVAFGLGSLDVAVPAGYYIVVAGDRSVKVRL